MKTLIGVAALSLLVATAMPASGDHGLVVTYVGVDLSTYGLTAAGQYVSGVGNAQTWEFTVYDPVFGPLSSQTPVTCLAFGSIEVGWTGCPYMSGMASGVFSPYPSPPTPAVVQGCVLGFCGDFALANVA